MAAEPYTLVVRTEGKVRKTHYSALTEAVTELEREGRDLAAGAHERPQGGTLIRRLEPVQIVVARLEALRTARGCVSGVDVRGDGSSEAFSGRLRRRVLEQRDGESAYDALRRALS